MRRVLLMLVLLVGITAVGVWSGTAAYQAGSAEGEEAAVAAADAAHEAAYEKAHERAYQQAYDEAYRAAAAGGRDDAYQQAYDQTYEEAYRENYIAAYAQEAMEFQCEGTIPDPVSDEACKSSAYEQAREAYERLGR